MIILCIDVMGEMSIWKILNLVHDIFKVQACVKKDSNELSHEMMLEGLEGDYSKVF